MEKNLKNSMDQAATISVIGMYMPLLNTEYLRSCASDFLVQAGKQESLAVLNPMYLQEKNELLREQAKAINTLCNYVDSLKKIDELKVKIKAKDDTAREIANLFI